MQRHLDLSCCAVGMQQMLPYLLFANVKQMVHATLGGASRDYELPFPSAGYPQVVLK